MGTQKKKDTEGKPNQEIRKFEVRVQGMRVTVTLTPMTDEQEKQLLQELKYVASYLVRLERKASESNCDDVRRQQQR